jgi:preprotein translocase subunit SecG
MNRTLVAVLVVAVLALLVFLLLKPTGGVDPGTVAPRGENAPASPNPEDAALLKELSKAKR